MTNGQQTYQDIKMWTDKWPADISADIKRCGMTNGQQTYQEIKQAWNDKLPADI